MTCKLDEIERLQDVRAETERVRTELREHLEVLDARFKAAVRQIDELRGMRQADQAPLTERIVALVGELGEVGPGRLGDLLAVEDPAVNKASVRAMLGQLVYAGRLTKPGRGRYAVSAG
jgi:chromosome segregation ATPase